MVDMATAAVDEGIALWYKLIVQGEQFQVDEAQLMMVRARSSLTLYPLYNSFFVPNISEAYPDAESQKVAAHVDVLFPSKTGQIIVTQKTIVIDFRTRFQSRTDTLKQASPSVTLLQILLD